MVADLAGPPSPVTTARSRDQRLDCIVCSVAVCRQKTSDVEVQTAARIVGHAGCQAVPTINIETSIGSSLRRDIHVRCTGIVDSVGDQAALDSINKTQ